MSVVKPVLKWRLVLKVSGVMLWWVVRDGGVMLVANAPPMAGPPSAPQPPFEVINVYSNKCHLRWNKPKDDGGVEIEKYLVEVFDVVEQEVVQSKSVKGDTQCSVDALLQNHRYTFKVRACNSEGSSDWLYHDKEVIAKDPWGKKQNTLSRFPLQ